jgi:threonine/homoserine/homoserine lactone efflux protein
VTAPLAFAAAVIVLLFAPGPTNAVLAMAGAEPRRRSVLPLLAAELVAYMLGVSVSRLVLLPLIDIYPLASTIVKLVVAVYLLTAGWRLWQSRPIAEGAALIGWRQVFATTALNPKGLLLAIGIFPPDDPSLALYFAGFAVAVIASGLTWFMAGRALARIAGRRADVLPKIGAGVLFGFAAYLAGTA